MPNIPSGTGIVKPWVANLLVEWDSQCLNDLLTSDIYPESDNNYCPSWDGNLTVCRPLIFKRQLRVPSINDPDCLGHCKNTHPRSYPSWFPSLYRHFAAFIWLHHIDKSRSSWSILCRAACSWSLLLLRRNWILQRLTRGPGSFRRLYQSFSGEDHQPTSSFMLWSRGTNIRIRCSLRPALSTSLRGCCWNPQS